MNRNKVDKVCRVVIELDCLLDTRLGTIAKYNSELANSVLHSKEDFYHERKTDDFPGLDREFFYSLYAQRDLETLYNSRPTSIIKFLVKNHEQLATNIKTQVKNETLIYQINTFPYLLTPVEKEDIIFSFKHWLSISEVKVECVNISPLQLTPKYIDSYVSAIFMYDYWSWLNVHANELQKCCLADVTLFCPEIIAGNGEDIQELIECISDGGPDPFARINIALREYIEIFYLSIDHFSVLNNLHID